MIQRFYPKRFELAAFTVHLGFEDFHPQPIQNYCESLEVPYEVISTQIQDIVFQHKSPLILVLCVQNFEKAHSMRLL